MQFIERLNPTSDLATILLLSSFVIFAAAKYFYPKRFDEFILLILSNKYFLVHGKNDEIWHPFNVLLFIGQVMLVSLFVLLLFKVFNPEEFENNRWLFLQISTAYTVFVLIKFSIEKIIGNVFSIDTLINQYLYQKLSYRNSIALLLFMGNLFFFYAYPPTSISLFIFIGIIFILNALSLLNSYKNWGTLVLGNFSYFILYLCALEISPYIILYKTFV